VQDALELNDAETLRALLGPGDRNLRRLREALAVRAVARDRTVRLSGEREAVERGLAVLAVLLEELERTGSLPEDAIERALAGPSGGAPTPGGPGSGVRVFSEGRYVRPRTEGQARYLEAMAASDIVFSIGPAGTGKTYLAVAHALGALARGEVRRIVLARPAVEAGERLGFLPGSPDEKVNPYLRPLYDALADMVPPKHLARHLERDVIEVVPLAYMRGRTIERAFAILDEAQNTTPMQMKMFLTRLGALSRAVVTGDVTQIDLDEPELSGLLQAEAILKGLDGIAFVYLDERDIVRHRLVRRIVEAYSEHGNQDARGGKG
jgi:phosphate starvation-inducible PhoH-like protein